MGTRPVQKPAWREIPIDEPRQRVGEDPSVYDLKTPEGIDELGAHLGEKFVENATGAEEHDTERLAIETLEDEGGPTVASTGSVEFPLDADQQKRTGAERFVRPAGSKPQRH
jgi:hypothetical protein